MKLLPVIIIKSKKSSDEEANFIDFIREINNGSSLHWIIQNTEFFSTLEHTPHKHVIANSMATDACYPISWDVALEIAPKIE